MIVIEQDLVIIRGINSEWRGENFSSFSVNIDTPINKDSYYLGIYSGAPDSAITHIGIIEEIAKEEIEDKGIRTVIHLKAIIKLKEPISFHLVRNFEYKKFEKLGLKREEMERIKEMVSLI